MKVLVTGATGLVGRPLVETLVKSGHSVTVVSRNPDQATTLWPFPVTAFRWRAEDASFPDLALEGIEAVIHLAGEGIADKRWSEARKKEILDSRVGGTGHLLDAIQKMKGQRPGVVISASAIGYYGSRGNELLTETSTVGQGFLADVCRDWEAELFKYEGSGIRLVALRTGIVLASNGGALKKMLPPFTMGVGGPVGDGKQWMSWIHRDDLIGIIVHAITHSRVSGPINGVAPNAVTNTDFSKALGRVLHRPAVMKAPAFALKLALGEMAELVLGSQRVSAEKISALGYSFKFPFIEAALADIVKKKA